MGLLEYIKANTPRATRPVASPRAVINQGLLNPNQFNAPSANRLKDSALSLLGILPGADAPVGFTQGADYFNRGENLAGGLAAFGALPLMPAIGGMFIGKGAKTWDAIKAQQAEEMLAKGIDPREVWKQTGSLKGVDGAVRQEIPDNAARIHAGNVPDTSQYPDLFDEAAQRSNGVPLGNALFHPKAYEAYLVYGAIKSPLAQPRNFLGGHIISALIGVTAFKLLGPHLWLAAPLAVAFSIAVMHATRTLHPPGGATALIAVISGPQVTNLGYLLCPDARGRRRPGHAGGGPAGEQPGPHAALPRILVVR